ncbi:hypothetical protein FRC11_014368, partial [Ceratobasidium sp. 423]
MQLREAYNDVQLKAPVAFRCHPLQRSIIAIAASGYLWSFTVIKKGDSKVQWSKAFTCGDSRHDQALSKLFAAAKSVPSDPATFDSNWAKRLLSSQEHTIYHGEDCLSTGISDDLL